MMWTKEFWAGLGERAVKTFFQTFIAVAIAGVGADAVGVSAGLTDVLWIDSASVAALAALLSAGTSFGNADFTAGMDAKDAHGPGTAGYQGDDEGN